MTTLFGQEHVDRYRETDGEEGHIWKEGSTVLLLTTRGRKSGKPTTTPLIYDLDGDNPVIVASKGGAPENSVSCIPSGARTRAFRSPHGVVTGGATCSPPAATSRAAASSLSGTATARRTVPDTRRPASIESTNAACASSKSSSVARPPPRRTTRPSGDVQSATCTSPSASR